MTLHEAIISILKENRGAMTSKEIADKLNEKNIYFKRDKSSISSSQVTARVNKYLTLFEKDNSVSPLKISLK
ncbi:hypothetical protein DVK85_10540 [Flavobacterium arcticum]|uniref:HTH HARE-type domain-containing protein n=1 Tax=Flavobacterium arcticum TaxID=1784713 RepID=A0A345HDI4_9FLAO|nr:hypothetical protein [Flavobacterium arcticum]AXG74644.1 hypothetical protein DVK85_10540 [Flavobacterium arcticum]KAF2512229.1 hypothetical protein E0W72_03125 [Flavobacterium arcticum]